MAPQHGEFAPQEIPLQEFADIADVGGLLTKSALRHDQPIVARQLAEVSFAAWGAAHDPTLGPKLLATIDAAQRAFTQVMYATPARRFLRDARRSARAITRQNARGATAPAPVDDRPDLLEDAA